jgi:hypothetical protein
MILFLTLTRFCYSDGPLKTISMENIETSVNHAEKVTLDSLNNLKTFLISRGSNPQAAQRICNKAPFTTSFNTVVHVFTMRALDQEERRRVAMSIIPKLPYHFHYDPSLKSQIIHNTIDSSRISERTSTVISVKKETNKYVATVTHVTAKAPFFAGRGLYGVELETINEIIDNNVRPLLMQYAHA